MNQIWLLPALAIALAMSSAHAEVPQGLFQLEERHELMATGALPESRAACLAVMRDPEWPNLLPISKLGATDGYGTDRSAEPFAWAVMVLSSRSLAGDVDASTDLRTLLTKWAKTGALSEVEEASDAFYALKRTLLPLIAGFGVEKANFSDEERELISEWIGRLVDRVNHRFGSEVDVNNHRTLLDSVLAVWGVTIQNEGMFEAGFSDLIATLDTLRDDGSLPLEAKRGARSGWYMRQTLASMLVIAEAAYANGRNIYSVDDELGQKVLRVSSYLANIVVEPEMSLAYSSVNYKPGSEHDFQKVDLRFLEERPTHRNYLAFLNILAARAGDSLSYQRLARVAEDHGSSGQPRIDEFVGGNASCFWGSK